MEAINIRDYAFNKHQKVDDYTYGGGAGMLMQAEPVYLAYEAIAEKAGKRPRVVYLTPQGQVFNQQMARDMAKEEDLVFLCGHYEGIDERVLEEIVTDYVSIGDYVLTGGELPAMVVIDTVSRLVPGVLHNSESAETESFENGLLEYLFPAWFQACSAIRSLARPSPLQEIFWNIPSTAARKSGMVKRFRRFLCPVIMQI